MEPNHVPRSSSPIPPLDQARISSRTPSAEKLLTLDEYSSAILSGTYLEESAYFLLPPSVSTNEKQMAVFRALSNLHVDNDGGGLSFSIIRKLPEATIILATPGPKPEQFSASFDAAQIDKLLKNGRYPDVEALVRHALIVLQALLAIDPGRVLLCKPGQKEQRFNLQELQATVIEELASHRDGPETGVYEITVSRTHQFERTMRLGEFYKPELCLAVALRTLGEVLRAQARGMKFYENDIKSFGRRKLVNLPKSEAAI